MSSLEDVIKRIRKLKALSTSNNVHEAAAAAAEAQRLMTEHRIAEASLATGDEADEPIVDEDVLRQLGNRSQVGAWEVILAMAVATSNGCKNYKTPRDRAGRRKGAFHLVGRQRDVDAAKYLFVMFRLEIERLANLWEFDNPGARRSTKTSFKYGAANELYQRLVQESTAAATRLKAASSMGHAGAANALVVFNRALEKAQAHVDQICGNGRSNLWGPSDMRAFRAGQEAGKGINLGRNHRQVGPGPRLIGGAS